MLGLVMSRRVSLHQVILVMLKLGQVMACFFRLVKVKSRWDKIGHVRLGYFRFCHVR
jgi:hypothetical protein